MRSPALFLVLLCGCAADPDLYKVVGIVDGDTIDVLDSDKEKHRVRLGEIDAPEKKQAFGTKAKEVLGDKVFGKSVRLRGKKKDQWERWIRGVYIGERCINIEMVEEGWAWHAKHYSKTKAYADAEVEARSKHLGLWQDEEPTPPWEFRKHKE